MTDASGSFVRGIWVGIATSAVLVHIWLAVELHTMRGLYAEFRSQPPLPTRITVSPLWLWTLPALGTLAIAALIARRPRRQLPYAALALALVLFAVATWHFSQAPIHALADAIH